MRLILVYVSVLALSLGTITVARRGMPGKFCWCWSGDQHMTAGPKPQLERNEYVSYGSYGSEADWNDPNRILPLDYNQDQGRRVFYEHCVWCHADTTPAGPSNRSNVNPDPPLMNDGNILNKESDASLRKIIAQGGSAVGKSPMMPPYGATLTEEDIDDLITYMRVIAVPEYKQSAKENSALRN